MIEVSGSIEGAIDFLEFEKLNALEARVIKWSESKGIFSKSTPAKQLEKTREEVAELESAFDWKSVKEEAGDVVVTLINALAMIGGTLESSLKSVLASGSREIMPFDDGLVVVESAIAEQNYDLAKSAIGDLIFAIAAILQMVDSSLPEALEMAVKKIDQRNGEMIDGFFVKDGD